MPQVVTHHPLQAFSRQYFTGDPRLFSYAADLCEARRLAGDTEQQPGRLVTVGLPEPDATWRTVEVARLLDFFGHPTRYFLQQRLGIFLEEAPASSKPVSHLRSTRSPDMPCVRRP